MKKPVLAFILCLLMAPAVFADLLTLNYYPNFNVNGDEEELSDWTPGDDYTYLTLNETKSFSLKYSYQVGYPVKTDDVSGIFVYLDYTTFNPDSSKREPANEKYQSITGGISGLGELYSGKDYRTFFSMGLGVGGSRFELPESEHRGTVEMFLEGGIVLYKHLFLSIGGKYQVIGKPTETMAESSGLYAGISVRY